jgi:CRP-like cAMP-binding protein
MRIVPNLHNWRKHLSKAALEDLSRLLTIKKYSKGQYIYSLGEASFCSFQIISGLINVCTYSEGGDELILSNLHPGDCIGDMGLITGQYRVNYAIACEDSVLNVLNREHFESLCLKHPEILVSINKLLCHRLNMVFEQLEDSYLLPLYQRLAKTIVRLGLSHAKVNEEDTIVINNVSQVTLGLMVGASRQSIARELKKMEAESFLTLKYNKLTILNLKGMVEKFEHIFPQEHMIPSYPEEKL